MATQTAKSAKTSNVGIPKSFKTKADYIRSVYTAKGGAKSEVNKAFKKRQIPLRYSEIASATKHLELA